MKPLLLFRGPVKSRSGYGAHSRDILESLYKMDLFDIKIDSCPWGMTPLTALDNTNPFHIWIESNIVVYVERKPDFYIQVTIPSEFNPLGNINIGITAGIETTIAPKDWVDGCNRMDLVIATSTFSKNVLVNTVYDEMGPDGSLLNRYKVNKPVEVLFEGINTNIYNNHYENFKLDIPEDFAFLFVGNWLKGDIGEDRKNVGLLIKAFAESFNDYINGRPALILKTSAATFSVKERESLRKKIKIITKQFGNCPPIYLLFGELTDKEMNDLYNHPKVKGMISLTHGEGFGRPLLEFTMSGKPVIAPNWSGHKDFLPMDKSIMIGGTLKDVHPSAVDNYIIKESKWFNVNYDEAVEVMRIFKRDYDKFLHNSEELRTENINKFSFDKMTEEFKNILKPFLIQPKKIDIVLPELTRVG